MRCRASGKRSGTFSRQSRSKIQAVREDIIRALEKAAGYIFHDAAHAEMALSHTSYSRHIGKGLAGSNERMEYLGDALRHTTSARHLFTEYPEDDEGALSRKSARAVSGRALANAARSMGLGLLVMLSPQEEATGGRMRQSILAGCFEALIAAIYLDGGTDAAEGFLASNLLPHIAGDLSNSDRDAKSALQEALQGKGRPAPEYRMVSRTGPDHAPSFIVEALAEEVPIGRGSGSSLKEAEQAAAQDALNRAEASSR